MDKLIPFDYHGKEVRTVQKDGDPWFITKDVCEVLDLGNSSQAISRLDDDEKGVISNDTLGGAQEMSIITESGLYSLILGSKKPEAKPFKRWVTHEVIPTIRKTGGYVSDDDAFVNTYLPFADETTKALFKSTLATVRQQNAKIEQDKPKVLFADSVAGSSTSILIRDLATILKQNGIDTGEKRLHAWLRNNGYLIRAKGRDYGCPTQKSLDLKVMEKTERTINPPDHDPIVKSTTLITGKGQTYFINKFLNKE